MPPTTGQEEKQEESISSFTIYYCLEVHSTQNTIAQWLQCQKKYTQINQSVIGENIAILVTRFVPV